MKMIGCKIDKQLIKELNEWKEEELKKIKQQARADLIEEIEKKFKLVRIKGRYYQNQRYMKFEIPFLVWQRIKEGK